MLLSEHFSMGYGGLEHNLRIRRDDNGSVRQNGVAERRFINEQLVIDNDLLNESKDNYVNRLIHKVVENKIGKRLAELNAKHLKSGHPERVRTVDDFIQSQMWTKKDGEQRKIVHEYIVGLGNKFTACPFDMEIDGSGHIIDVNGNQIKSYDTRKNPAYKNGKITESKRCKLIKKVYRRFVQEFKKKNPMAEVICASIHGDEYGGLHMHLNVIWFNRVKNSVGYGLSYSSAMRQQFEDRGITCGDTQKQNGMTKWRTSMKVLLKQVAMEYGIEKQKMGNTDEHKAIPKFKNDNDEYVKMLEDKEKELQEKEKELSSDIAKQEWYLLKTKFPEMYQKIHEMYQKNKKSVKFSIDKSESMVYNSGVER